MSNTVPSYTERMDAARERLRAALDPQSGPEKSIVAWLRKWDITTLDVIAGMVERVRGGDSADCPACDGIELDVRLRLDPNEPHTEEACALTESLDGRSVIVVTDLLTVDELRLGHMVAMLLVNADQCEGGAS